jgi:hypothetical protein
MAKGGLMYEASVGGQKFSFAPYEQADSEEADPDSTAETDDKDK